MLPLLRGLVLALVVASAAACSDPGTPTPRSSGPIDGCERSARVLDGAPALEAALATARPGDSFALAEGRYAGPFVIRSSGTRARPITVCATRTTVLAGDSLDHGYTLHLDGASFWHLRGFSVAGGQKGIVLDGSSDNVLTSLSVSDVGDEAVHLRADSQDNLVEDSVIRSTGLREPSYGEGIYVGSAESNWCDLTDCRPDRSDGNRLVGNTVSRTTAEAVDVKEGTSDGELRGNRLASPVGGAVDSVVDLKGNAWVLRDNRIDAEGLDAVQIHVVVEGWGAGNRILRNAFFLRGGGYAVNAEGAAGDTGNTVACDQKIHRPDTGKASNVPCS